MQLLFVFLIAYILMILQRKVYIKNWDKNLYVNVSFDKNHVTEGEDTTIIESVINDKWLPLPFLFFNFKLEKGLEAVENGRIAADDKFSRNDMINVLMKQSIKKYIKIKCCKRGKYKIDNFSIQAYNLLLDRNYSSDYCADSTLTVYPGTVDARRFEQMIKKMEGDLKNNSSLQVDPFLMRGLREYQTYDEMRFINWKATAKANELRVNVLDKINNSDVYIYVNLEVIQVFPNYEILEESIRLGKTFAVALSEYGIKSCIMTNGKETKSERFIAVNNPDSGPAYLNRVDEALAEICLEKIVPQKIREKSEESFIEYYGKEMKKNARKGFIILISNSRDSGLCTFMKNLKRERDYFAWIVPVAKGLDYEAVNGLEEYEYIWRLNYDGTEM